MSMSTNIADLPGPLPDETEDIYTDEEQQYQELEEYENTDYVNNEKKEILYEQPSSIKMDIKKTQKYIDEQNILKIIKSEVNEENLLILIVLYVATTNMVNQYAKKLLSIISFESSINTINIVKCLILLIGFIVIKRYILPYFKI